MATAKKRGRPALPPEEKKRPSMGFRPTPDLRRRLEAATDASGRSLSQEIESRLERSFSEEPGSRAAYHLIRLFGAAIGMAEQQSGKAVTDYQTYVMAQNAISRLLDQFKPLVPDEIRRQQEAIYRPDVPYTEVINDPDFEAQFTGRSIGDVLLKQVQEVMDAVKADRAGKAKSAKKE
jgi:hypothetical protein